MLNILPLRAQQARSFTKMRKSLIAVTQLNCKEDKSENLAACSKLIEKAAFNRAKAIFLPENCDYIAPDSESVVAMAEPLDGDLIREYQRLAKKFDIWISVGGFHQKIANREEKRMKIKNTHVLISSDGSIASEYDKIHLFDVSIPEEGVHLKESAMCDPGVEIKEPVNTPFGNVALGVCYDLRFPEMAQAHAALGADILTFPSAFTVATGMAHWEPLLRARAIETQCYVIAAAQTGKHNPKRISYGHAMVVDPWGAIIAQCSEGVGIAFAEVDLDYLKSVRTRIPVQSHKRPDIYLEKFSRQSPLPENDAEYQFGQVTLKGEIIFYVTKYTMAFVNLKCVVPGHVLVSPIRPALRIENMDACETTDLFLTVKKVQAVLEKVHETTSSTMSIQDGVDAGQTIRHVHVHVLPRKMGDFERPDDIYNHIHKHDKTDEKPSRSREDMVEECKQLRKYFC
ncbi:nitrilase and fragile histidine triad fusion protein NitFhit-like [Artemia franciscana]|uniref:Nitrilase and fragile histidine triad fusion protein NitFhit n=1 Tax=Artemia franciscana TaxID=6661 RepID=A0AA88LAQ3_ARTSF|nr:hypothetical protein QYM36_008836 [Artemia franciscana]KAK2714405.1 hypothetical protein QYM36_008836 [Artemia franciscana]